MTYAYTTTISIHPSAMGHVIGKRGVVINRICNECNVVTNNTRLSECQKTLVIMTINGHTRDAVQQALYQIDHQIAISNEWCRNNGVDHRL